MKKKWYCKWFGTVHLHSALPLPGTRSVVESKGGWSVLCGVCALLCASVVCGRPIGISFDFDFAAFCLLLSLPSPPLLGLLSPPQSSPPVLAPPSPRRRARAGGSPLPFSPASNQQPAAATQLGPLNATQRNARLAGSAQHRTISGSISGQRPTSHPRVLNATPTAGWLG